MIFWFFFFALTIRFFFFFFESLKPFMMHAATSFPSQAAIKCIAPYQKSHLIVQFCQQYSLNPTFAGILSAAGASRQPAEDEGGDAPAGRQAGPAHPRRRHPAHAGPRGHHHLQVAHAHIPGRPSTAFRTSPRPRGEEGGRGTNTCL